MKSPFYTAEHDAFRDVMRRFVDKEIAPFAHEWDEAGEFPRALYRNAAEIGLLGLGFPQEYGGIGADQFMKIVAWRLEQGESPVAEICMMKNQATQTMAFCASEAVQIFGGAGFMRGIKAERIYREVKVNAIGGGTEEIMKDLASRQMGL